MTRNSTTRTTGGENWKQSIKPLLTSLRNVNLNENAPSVTDLSIRSPFYRHVPKEPIQNLRFREYIYEQAYKSTEMREQLWMACNRDLLFWVNVFAFVFEPREALVLPFVTWDFQDRVFLITDYYMGKKDIGIEKSRDMGASWMFLTNFFYRWLFKPKQVFGLVSRTEDACDKRDDPDTLFWKLDFHYKMLPCWMRPKASRVRLAMKNISNESVINGYSATGDVARGGRKLAFGMDELAAWGIDDGFAAWASTQHVSNSRIAVSTPQGMAGIFAEQMRSKNASMVKISIHWSEHPEKQKGLYKSTGDMLDVIDTTYRFEPDYPFVMDGKIRSPWYDEECRRHPVPALIAQELDIDYGGSGFPFFNAKIVDAHMREYAMEPFVVGELDFIIEDHEPTWRQQDGGRLRLWCHITTEGRPSSNHDYVIGCDVATGHGGEMSTNSVASIVNRDTGEKVAEFATNELLPHRFADYVVALRKWFRGPKGDAFVVWETNGPGNQFGKHFMQVSPGRVYYREQVDVVGAPISKSPGWRSTKDLKRLLLAEYGKALERGWFVNRSAVALDEMYHYIHAPNGSVDHDRSKSTLDPTAAGENHGDRVIADALAWRAVGSIPDKVEDSKKLQRDPPVGSMAWRMKISQPARKEVWL